MKKWWCILTVLLLAGAALAWRVFDEPVITRENFDVLKIGMTQPEVERILGGARNECHDSVMAWAPRGDTLNSVRIDPGNPGVVFFLDAHAETQGDEQVWLAETGLIAILFDKDGRLHEKHFSDVNVMARPTPLDWLRAKFF